MNRFFLAFLLLMGPLSATSWPVGHPIQAPAASSRKPPLKQPEASGQQPAAIRHVLASQVDAWNRGDLPAYMEGYWRSPDLVFFSGATETRGWQPTLERYQKRYAAPGKEMGKLEFSDVRIDMLSQQAAVVTGKWKLTMSDGKTPHGLFTLIFKKISGGWKIVHDHSSGE